MKKVLFILITILVLPLMVNAKEYRNVKINDGTIYSEGDVIKDIQGLPIKPLVNDGEEIIHNDGSKRIFMNDPYTYLAGTIRYHVITGNNNGNIEYKRLGTYGNGYTIYADFENEKIDSLYAFGYSFVVDSTKAGTYDEFAGTYKYLVEEDCEAGESYKNDGKIRQWELRDYDQEYAHESTCTYFAIDLDTEANIFNHDTGYSGCEYTNTEKAVIINLYEVAPKTEEKQPTVPEETPTDEEPIENPETGVYDVLSLVFLIVMLTTVLYIKAKENNLFKQI